MHVEEGGKSVSDLELENFYGEAQVLDMTDCEEKVDRKDLEEKRIAEDIILLKTGNSLHVYERFREDFTYLTLEGVDHLVEEGVKMVGIDYLSLVKFEGGDKAEKAHKKANEEMTMIEGLDLRDVDPGHYTFSGTPLKIDTDGAPMRALLVDKD